MNTEEKDEQWRHQRPAADASESDKQTNEKPGEGIKQVDVVQQGRARVSFGRLASGSLARSVRYTMEVRESTENSSAAVSGSCLQCCHFM
jgi:hypothetical protein